MDFSQIEWVDQGVVLDSSESGRAYVVRSKSGKYIRLSSSAFRLIQHAKEGRTVEELAAAMRVPPEQVRAAYAKLAEKLDRTDKQEVGGRSGFFFTYDVVPARWVVKASALFTWTYHWRTAALLGALVLAAVVAFIPMRATTNLRLDPLNAAYGYGLYFLSLLIHELGHSSACLRFGAMPNTIGVGVYLVFPVLYSDVSAAWTLTRWQRAAVDMGGVYLQTVTGALFLTMYMITGWSPWLLAVAGIGGTVLFSLNPLLRFDGYWAIADMLGVNNFSQQGSRVLRHFWQRLRGQRPTELPWPAWVVAVLGAYTVLSFVAIIWIMVRMAPYLLGRLATYPEVVRQLIERLVTPGEHFGLKQAGAFVAATFSAFLAGLILYRMGSGFVVSGATWIRERLSRAKAPAAAPAPRPASPAARSDRGA